MDEAVGGDVYRRMGRRQGANGGAAASRLCETGDGPQPPKSEMSPPETPPAAPDPAPAAASVVKSAGRALQVLELFESGRRPLRATEIAQAMEMPQSSTSMLLRSLRELGYLDFDPRAKTYLPSLRVALLGAWLGASGVRDGRLIGMLEHLARTTGHSAMLATRHGIFSQYVYIVPSDRAMRYQMPVGTKRLLVRSGSGVMLLADEPDAEIAALARRSATEFPDHEIDVPAVMARVAQARAQGWYLSLHLATAGAGALAMRLPAEAEAMARPMVVVVAGIADELDREKEALAARMRDAIDLFAVDRAGEAPKG